MSVLVLLTILSVPGQHAIEAARHRPVHPAVRIGSRPTALVPRAETTMTREVYGYLPHWASQHYVHFDLLTAIGCFDVTLNPDGTITNDNGFPDAWSGTIDRAHRNGVRCEMVATCFGWPNIQGAIRAPASIPNLVELADSAGVDGINMDFEDILGSDRDTMVVFMQRLSAACRQHGLSLTMATMPLDFQNAYDFAALAETTDGLFMMEYNYHWPGCPEAGPNAPQFGWEFYGNLQMSLDQYLSAIGNGRKLLFGLPYYGYDWPTYADTVASRTTGTGSDLYYIDARAGVRQHGRRWEAVSHTPWYAYNSGGWHQGWFDDDSSLMLKYREVWVHDLLGTGMWALGYDGNRTELWSALRESFNRPAHSFSDGGFETWGYETLAVPTDTNLKPAGWYEGRYAKARREAAIAHGGSYALQQEPDTLDGSGPVPSAIYQDVQVSPGAPYEFRGWARKNDHSGNRMKLAVQWYDNLHSIIREDSSDALTRDSTAWRELTTGTIFAPSEATLARVELCVAGSREADLWDDLSFAEQLAANENRTARRFAESATIQRGMLFVPQSPLAGPRSRPVLFDFSGRMVGELHVGTNDLSRLAPGVYFLQQRPDFRPAKLIITR